MDLTKVLLGTIIKYPVSSLEPARNSCGIRTEKTGYFYGDRENFRDVQASAGTCGRRYPLAFILEAADYICGVTDSFAKDMYQVLNSIS